MKIHVYVEGPSDRLGLEALLRDLIAQGKKRWVGLTFHSLEGKDAVIEKAPIKAADHLSDHPDDWVVALPDLYPMSVYDDSRNAHRSFPELQALLQRRFGERADRKELGAEVRKHFLVHCLKHDLEVLLLAAPDQLRKRLGTKDALKGAWRKPVEDQNDDQPPKSVVERLFTKYRKRQRYQDTSDASWILGRADLAALETACPQNFAPFVHDLRTAIGM